MNSETALGCFQVMSYVNSVAIGIILEYNWVPHQCVVTSLETHRSSNGYFVITFPTTHASSLHLTFPFPSPKPTTVTPQPSCIINFMGLYACQFFRFNFFILILEGFFFYYFFRIRISYKLIFLFFVFVEHILSDLGGPSLF